LFGGDYGNSRPLVELRKVGFVVLRLAAVFCGGW